MTGLPHLPMHEVARLTRSGQLGAEELVGESLRQLEAVEPAVRAFVLVDGHAAMQTAKRLDQLPASERGALHGIPVAVKDIFDVAGHPTRRGSRAYDDAAAAESDAEVVRALRQAGAVIVGKTTTHELACGVYTPPTGNPWDPGRSAGGSSGGSGAAVAARVVFGATGSDTGGSVRIPAALCGVVGLKPTYGRVSRAGVATLAWSLDHVGPITCSVADAWLMLDVLAGEDERDPATVGLPPLATGPSPDADRPPRLGIVEEVFQDNLTDEVRQVWDATLGRLTRAGCDLVSVGVPALPGALAAEFAIVLAEGAAYYERLLGSRSHDVGIGVRTLLHAGLALPSLTYLRAQRTRVLLQQQFARAFDTCQLDAVLTPTLPATAQRPDQVHLHGEGGETVADAFVRTTGPFNLTGMPCVSLPAGLGPDGLPVGVQLAGRPYGEAALQSVARFVEDCLGPAPRPPLAS